MDRLKYTVQMESQQSQAQDWLPITGIFHPGVTPPVAVQLVKLPCPKISSVNVWCYHYITLIRFAVSNGPLRKLPSPASANAYNGSSLQRSQQIQGQLHKSPGSSSSLEVSNLTSAHTGTRILANKNLDNDNISV